MPSARVQARWSGDVCTRWLVLLCLLIGALALIFILGFTGYPHPPYRLWVSEYLMRTQDLAGGLLLMALVIAACFAPLRPAALAFVDAISRHPWRTASTAFVMLCLGSIFIEQNHPLAQDEYAALFQSQAFAAGRLTGQFPPELVSRLIPPSYINQFLYASTQTGQVASAYWPGFALLLAPFSFVHAPWAANPLLASLALVAMGRIATRLTGERQATGWAMLLALGSPGFTAMAITYFSMTAHLLLNLVFVWLLLERTAARLVLAGVVGSFALVLHNPLPHTLFALPWIIWLALQPGRYRLLFALAAGYLPLVLVLGFGWALLLSGIQGSAPFGLFPSEDNPLHRVANFLWTWHIKMRSAVALPGGVILSARVAEMARLWSWTVPGLPLLAAAGWWLGRRHPELRLLGLSLVATLAGYLFIGYTQGHGWGARYVHSGFGALPVLAAVALVSLRPGHPCGPARSHVASLAVLSLVFATALRAAQIHDYLEMHLSNRPPFAPAARQIVFIRRDWETYSPDLVQNDPLLRRPVWFMLSRDPQSDANFMREKFPHARRQGGDRRGEVWRLDPS